MGRLIWGQQESVVGHDHVRPLNAGEVLDGNVDAAGDTPESVV
jgi:hypothetical protein